MRNIKNNNKKGFLKKIFIKLCRILGYEIIDQNNFYFPVSEISAEHNLSTIGKRSISLGLGETKITRPVKSLDIILKTCTSVNLVTQSKKRVFESNKSEYTFRTIKSLLNSVRFNENIFRKIDLKFTIIDHNSSKSDLELINDILKKSLIKYQIINLDVNEFSYIKTINKNNPTIEANMKATMASILKSFKIIKENSADLIYFVEDDYIHKKEGLGEMIFTYEKFASEFKQELFLCPVDYPYLYKSAENTNILIGNNYHWRTVKESLLTFMTSKKMIDKHWDKLLKMSETEHSPFEMPLHKIYEEEVCLSPVPSLALHCTNVNSVYGLSPNINWRKLWEENKV
jgi:hypothetical protein